MISTNELTRAVVLEHRRWLLSNAGDASEVDACRQYFDKRLGARRRIEAKERICASINRRRAERPGDDRLTKEQLRQLLAYARHINDTKLAAACQRAIDGDSAYHGSIMERCAAAYAGARTSDEFKCANRAKAKP